MLEIFIDGASAGNPGPSAIGIFIRGEGHNRKIAEYIGETNNHIAEFTALIRALEEAKKLHSTMVAIRSDSKIVVASVDKHYVKNDAYKPLLQQAIQLIVGFDLFFIEWIPDNQNKAADALARQALQQHKKSLNSL